MTRVVFFGCMLAAISWLVTGCEKSPPKVAKTQAAPRTNRLARVVTPKPKPVREIFPGTIEYLDSRNGFRDATFGQTEASFANLTEINADEARQLKTFRRSDEIMAFEGIPLTGVEYRFFRGELYAIQVQWKMSYPDNVSNRPATTELATHLTSEYGPPRKHLMTKDGNEYIWRGRRVQISLIESLFPGVADVNGGWAIAPTTSGRMVIRNLMLSRAAEGDPTGRKSRASL